MSRPALRSRRDRSLGGACDRPLRAPEFPTPRYKRRNFPRARYERLSPVRKDSTVSIFSSRQLCGASDRPGLQDVRRQEPAPRGGEVRGVECSARDRRHRGVYRSGRQCLAPGDRIGGAGHGDFAAGSARASTQRTPVPATRPALSRHQFRRPSRYSRTRCGKGEIAGLSVAGQRTNDSAYLLDGVINTDPDYNALSYVPVVDSIAEFQVPGGAV